VRPVAADARLAAFAALLAAVIALAYANSFGIGFHFDDITGIAQNPSVASLRSVPRFFADPFLLTTTRENVDVRPVLQVTFALNYAISGLHPWSWHALNLLLHFTAALLVFVIVRDHLWPAGTDLPIDPGLAAGAAALLFAVAPLNTQPVDYMWARSALLCTALYLGAFRAALRERWVTSAVLHALALLTKAIALTLPAAILLYLAVYRSPRTGASVLRDWRRAVRGVVALVVLDVAYLVYRTLLLPPWAKDTIKESFTTPWIWLMSQWSAQLYYVRLFVWPDRLSIDHAFPYAFSFAEPRAWGALLGIVVWIGVSLALARRHRVVAFATLWFFLTLAVESTVSPLAEVINDHRPYIASSLGLAVWMAWILALVASRLGARARLAFVAATVALCAAAMPMTRYRNWQWQDYVRIWQDAAEKGPTNGRAWMNAGTGLMARGDLAGARRDFERAREAAPGYSYVYMNLAVLDAHEGRLAEALRQADQAVRLNPELALTHYYRGYVLERLRRRDDAAAEYERTVAIDPRNAQARAALAGFQTELAMREGLDALYARHDPARAAERFRAVLAAMPTHYGATYQLAKALDEAGRTAEATPVWARMLAMAEAAGDQPVVATCRERLARRIGGPGGR
jgi:tetratricopeptide (TPR) repeat protein